MSVLMTALLHVQIEHRDWAVRPLAYHLDGMRNFQLKMRLGSNLGTRARKIVVFIVYWEKSVEMVEDSRW